MVLAAIPALLALAASFQTSAQAVPVPIAVTRSGLRVECQGAKPGDLLLRTPLGNFSTPLDSVREVVDGAAQLESLLALHRAGTLDDLGLAMDLSTAGQLTALAEHAAAFAERNPESVQPYLILEAWGVRLDPIPRELPSERRVDWLWEKVLGKDWATSVLCGVRLREEVSAAYQAPSERVISISGLRKGLRRSQPQVRRVAARVAGKQQEFSLRAPLLLASLEDASPAARDGAALAAGEVQPKAARDYWSRVLALGEPSLRAQAALDLGRHGRGDGIKVLIHVLAAQGKPAGTHFEFGGRDIFVVSNYDSNAHDLSGYDVNHLDRAFSTADPNREYVELGSRFKVTRYGDTLREVILEALDLWAGEKTGRSSEQWLDWYLQSYAPTHP